MNISSHIDPASAVLFWLTLLLMTALFGRFIAKHFGQPGVLGEIGIGILLGNVLYAVGSPWMLILREGSAVYGMMSDLLQGDSVLEAIRHSMSSAYIPALLQALQSPDGMEYLKLASVLDIFSRYGVLFLLFIVGLETSVTELKRTGFAAVRVAFIGVIAPVLLGYIALRFLLPLDAFAIHIFIAATLSATSIGITARVLQELHLMKTREAHTILSAAMIDDVLGLLLLGVVASLVVQGSMQVGQGILEISVALLFLGASVFLGPRLLRRALELIRWLDPELTSVETKFTVSFVFLTLMAWLSTQVGLAAIIGAFSAGLIIDDGYFGKGSRFSIREIFYPLEMIFAPLFFILMGLQVKLELFASAEIWWIAAVLTVAAVLGKCLSGLGAARGQDRLLIGFGMLPRGEVGIVFASVGKSLGVMSDTIFSAIMLMVIITTCMTPWLLKRRVR